MTLNPHWFFQNQEEADELRLEALSWIGTPFREYSKQKGPAGGVDCVRLCESIYCSVGLMEPFEFPVVPMNFTQHRDRSIVLEFMRGEYPGEESKRMAAHFQETPFTDSVSLSAFVAMAGDLLCFKIGKAVNHVGVALDAQRFVHCYRGAGVTEGTLRDPSLAERLHTVFRPIET